jgi:ribosomal protein S18 acetylase RimI-like enzyme
MRSFQIEPAAAVEPARLHAAFALAFSDYLIGPFKLPPEQWPGFLARQAVDMALSRVALRGGEVLAFALVAPRPDAPRWRLATMGAVPAARGSGAAPALLDDFIERAAQAGQPAVELEVFAQNERAVHLYRGRGFEVRHALWGYRWPGGAAGVEAPPVQEVDREAAFAWLDAAAAALPELPLQVTPTVLRALPNALQCWRRGHAQLVFSRSGERPAVVHSLVDRDAAQHDAQALVHALLARHAEHGIEVPQLQRADVGGAALERAGFQRQPLHQWLMQRAAYSASAEATP